MDTGECWFQRRLVEAIASDDFGRRTGREDTLWMTGKAPHRAAIVFQASKKTAADVTSGAGEQNHSTHVASLNACTMRAASSAFARGLSDPFATAVSAMSLVPAATPIADAEIPAATIVP
jgi:hypothetical protein